MCAFSKTWTASAFAPGYPSPPARETGTDASKGTPLEKATESSSAWHETDAFAIGASVAGLLVLVAILIPCYLRGNSALKFRSRSK